MIMSQLDDSNNFRLHFHWMYSPSGDLSTRMYFYSTYDATAGVLDGIIGVTSPDEYAGFTTLDVTNDNRAVLGGHLTTETSNYHSEFLWDFGPGSCNFLIHSPIPDSLNAIGQYTPGAEEDGYLWPAICYQEGAQDTVLHVFAVEANTGAHDPKTLAYFRAVSPEGPAHWSMRIVDTIYNVAQDCDCTDDGKVALTWIANLPVPGDCDTCSSINYWKWSQWDNDLYWQISNDGGLTWAPRVNVTRNVDGVGGFRPYTDMSALITTDGNLHVVWGARYWPADANYGGDAGLLRGCIFHASEDNIDGDGNPLITTVHNAMWDQTTCNGGAWMLNASKMSLAECDGKLYVLFVQFNDIPAGRGDDCAAPNSPAFPRGAANGDLYLAVSGDYGLTWDDGRNITNTYTPDCDSVGGIGGACASENWPSMVKYGYDYQQGIWPTGIILDPSIPPDSPYTGSYYLDAMYIADPSAGAVVQGEGYSQDAWVKWCRIPCVEPRNNPLLVTSPAEFAYPLWTKHGVQKDTVVLLENAGNVTLNTYVTTYELAGPSGWLSITGFPSAIAAGANNRDSGVVSINAGGIVNTQGTTVYLSGGIVITSNASSSPDTIPIECWVADTLYEPVWDTVNTSCTKLIVSSYGNFGRTGFGKVNMDYYSPPADTHMVFLYDGSPVVGYPKGTDTVVGYSMYREKPGTENSFFPMGGYELTADSSDYQIFRSGKFVTPDSLIAIEKDWYAPQSTTDSCNFVIERLTVYCNRDTNVLHVRVGEAIDWDIPSANGAGNGSAYNDFSKLLYQYSCDYSFSSGGLFYLDSYRNGVRRFPLSVLQPYGAYTHDNATHVYPASGFVPESLYLYMDNEGYALSDSSCADLYSLMTFDKNLSLYPGDTFVYYVGIISYKGTDESDFLDDVCAAKMWYCQHLSDEDCGCCKLRGDADGSGARNVADLTYSVNFLFKGGPPPVCYEEGDADGSGAVNVADLTFLVNYLFKGGPNPPCCF